MLNMIFYFYKYRRKNLAIMVVTFLMILIKYDHDMVLKVCNVYIPFTIAKFSKSILNARSFEYFCDTAETINYITKF